MSLKEKLDARKQALELRNAKIAAELKEHTDNLVTPLLEEVIATLSIQKGKISQQIYGIQETDYVREDRKPFYIASLKWNERTEPGYGKTIECIYVIVFPNITGGFEFRVKGGGQRYLGERNYAYTRDPDFKDHLEDVVAKTLMLQHFHQTPKNYSDFVWALQSAGYPARP